jgi:hypothetical protein
MLAQSRSAAIATKLTRARDQPAFLAQVAVVAQSWAHYATPVAII